MRAQDLEAPLAQDGRVPTLYAALGATLHLEPIETGDVPALAEALALLHERLGPHFRWTRLSCWDEPIPHAPEHLEYITEYPANLVFEKTTDDPEEQAISLEIQTRPWSDYEVFCYGGDDAEGASPYQLRFWVEIPRFDVDEPVRAIPVLAFSAPCSTDPQAFRALVLEVAGRLRVRWGNAGLTFAYHGSSDDESAWEKQYAHARRFTGFDVPQYVRNLDVFAFLVRSVSWLTILGAPFASQLDPAAIERARAKGLSIGRFGEGGLLVQAGAAPDEGDRNRIGIPRLYVAADELVRPFRASDAAADEIVFVGPSWDYDSVIEWLRRFEVRAWVS